MIRLAASTGLALLLVAAAAAQPQPSPREASPARQAGRLVARLELPEQRMAAIAGLVKLDLFALGPLRRALDDPRPDVVRAALFAVQGLGATAGPLAAQVRARSADPDPGVAMAARRAAVSLAHPGTTLVADYQSAQILTIDARGEVDLRPGVRMVMDVERLPNGNLLIAEYGANRVLEIGPTGEEVWSCADVQHPSDVDRLPNGNTLVADSANLRAVEFDRAGKVVWEYRGGTRPIDVERCPNGNTLIASYNANGALEVTPTGEIVWQIADLKNVRDIDRLPDGTTMMVLTDLQRIRFVDARGRRLRDIEIGLRANDADLLPNGHFLVAGDGAVVELDEKGVEIWRHAVKYAGSAERY